MTLVKTVQIDEYVSLCDLKPEVSSGGIYFPVAVEHIDLNKYHGDARSFGYNFDDGPCSVIKYEQVVGILADDTVEMFLECSKLKKHNKKPNSDLLESSDNKTPFSKNSSELLIHYGNDFFYKDAHGFWFESSFCDEPYSYRVTDETAEIFREVNAEYQRKVKKHNKIMSEALDNIKLLQQTLDDNTEQVKTVKQTQELIEDKDNLEMLLQYFEISQQQFDNVTHDNIKEIVDTDINYKDPKRTLWHVYRVSLTAKSKPKKTRQKRSPGKQKALDNAARSRGAAKIFGLKALTGSARQKSWGEAMRKVFLEKVSDESVLTLMKANNDATKAKFWIETRSGTFAEIIECLTTGSNYDYLCDKSEVLSAYERKGVDSYFFKSKKQEFEKKYKKSWL